MWCDLWSRVCESSIKIPPPPCIRLFLLLALVFPYFECVLTLVNEDPGVILGQLPPFLKRSIPLGEPCKTGYDVPAFTVHCLPHTVHTFEVRLHVGAIFVSAPSFPVCLPEFHLFVGCSVCCDHRDNSLIISFMTFLFLFISWFRSFMWTRRCLFSSFTWSSMTSLFCTELSLTSFILRDVSLSVRA